MLPLGDKRQRRAYSSKQLHELQAYFQENQYVNSAQRRQLAQQTQLNERQVKIWFQNRRMKEKRQKGLPVMSTAEQRKMSSHSPPEQVRLTSSLNKTPLPHKRTQPREKLPTANDNNIQTNTSGSLMASMMPAADQSTLNSTHYYTVSGNRHAAASDACAPEQTQKNQSGSSFEKTTCDWKNQTVQICLPKLW